MGVVSFLLALAAVLYVMDGKFTNALMFGGLTLLAVLIDAGIDLWRKLYGSPTGSSAEVQHRLD